jgi:signal transduction histidine kinase
MSALLRVLLVEDSDDDASLLLRELRRGGYEVSHERVDTAPAMISALERQEWDLVISDHSMPHFSGDSALHLLKEKNTDLPFIFVSGTLGEETAVAALKEGAQDYLMKGNLKRLVPAIQRVIRESEERRERRRLEQHVQQLQKFEAIGRLAGGIAHDFNNALGAIMGWTELALAEAGEGSKVGERLQKILNQTQRAAGLTSQLLSFARRQVLQPKKIDLNALVLEGTSLLRRVIGEHIRVQIAAAPDLRVALADPTQVEQVIMNLCLNARDAMPKGGDLTIETRNVVVDEEAGRQAHVRPGSYVLLSVTDTGTGMDAATVEHIFEPFFTTKEMGKGTGLGLATVYGVVKQHGGYIDVRSQRGRGTSFHIYLPSDSGTPDQRGGKTYTQPRRGNETVLLAEDHDGLRQSAQEMLEALGYSVILASTGIEAVQMFSANAERVDIAVLDVVMPGLTGLDAYMQMLAVRADLGVIFTTGYASEAALLNSIVDKGASILQKPYDGTSLSQAIGVTLSRFHRAAPRK